MPEVYRSKFLVPLGWFAAFTLYIVQACVLIAYLVEHTGSKLWWIGVVIHIALAVVASIALWKADGYAQTDREVLCVWGFWCIYIVLYTISVAVIFGETSHKLDKSETLGPNFLKAILCIAPALLVLVMQLAISPSYHKEVLALSVLAALDLFDGIEMLEIVLMQNDWAEFKLSDTVETCIIVFACLSFLLTSLGLFRNKVDDVNTVKKRSNKLAVCFGLTAMLLTNLPFLVLRVYIWVDSRYEAAIFIAKNVVSLVLGLVEFGIARHLCSCGYKKDKYSNVESEEPLV